ncbi:hypothetical protein PZA11_004237 [Diplocarpon coronariae]
MSRDRLQPVAELVELNEEDLSVFALETRVVISIPSVPTIDTRHLSRKPVLAKGLLPPIARRQLSGPKI